MKIFFTCFGNCFLHELVVIIGGGCLVVGGSYRGVFRCGRTFEFLDKLFEFKLS